ncbi:hypothetical protein AAFF_G00189380 [Aldrovandia affinis]|uniref:Uncharacterized protein n=1 Tax=Aldrovandia affinis TaxID=143900 RepID=A0AAD7RJS8_9TELE|nr:hypothetical protein AAFF_G00189380 [Aldrovandia affinis]
MLCDAQPVWIDLTVASGAAHYHPVPLRGATIITSEYGWQYLHHLIAVRRATGFLRRTALGDACDEKGDLGDRLAGSARTPKLIGKRSRHARGRRAFSVRGPRMLSPGHLRDLVVSRGERKAAGGPWFPWPSLGGAACFVQRRLKRRREERLRERCLRTLEMEPLEYRGYPPREPPQFCPPHTLPAHTLPPSTWTSPQEADVFGKPPCYEEAVLMEDPPPPYSEILADSRGGTYTKPTSRTSRKQQDTNTSKAAPDTAFPERPYSSLIHLPMDEHWDSLGRLLSAMDLNRNNLPPADAQASALTATAREGRTNSELGLGQLQLDHTCTLPTAFPLFGRSTAV